MAIAAWQQFERSAFFQRNNARLRQLFGEELRLKPSIDVVTVNDAGCCYDASLLSADNLVYSLGIGDNLREVSFLYKPQT